MARRTVFVSLVCLLLCLGSVWLFPRAVGQAFTDTVEIRNKQVVYYLVPLENNSYFSINCSTYFNSSIKAWLLTERPLADTVNPAYVNASDTADNQNHTSLSIYTNESKIFYIQIDQMDDKSDFLLVNSTSTSMTRYYIPFIAGYPILETLLSITVALFVVQKIRRRGKRAPALG